MTHTGPNAEQMQYWADSGPRWVALQAMLDAQLEALGRVALDALAVERGASAIDVGCGCGQTTLELAGRVGPDGRVLGVDVSAPMLERARERVAEAGCQTVELQLADAQVHAFPPAAADAVFSRFGVMFFADPAAAFANLRAGLRPGGRIAFVCWQALESNPWMLVPISAARPHLSLPPPPPPGAPGPFSLADGARVCALLETAGFGRVRVEPYETTLTLGGSVDLEETTDFVLQLVGPLAAALRDADAAARTRVRSAVRAAIAPSHGPEGVRMPAAAWIATAERG